MSKSSLVSGFVHLLRSPTQSSNLYGCSQCGGLGILIFGILNLSPGLDSTHLVFFLSFCTILRSVVLSSEYNAHSPLIGNN